MVKLFYTTLISVDLAQYEIFRVDVFYFCQEWYNYALSYDHPVISDILIRAYLFRQSFIQTLFSPLVIYVQTRSVTKQNESLIPNDFVIVGKQIVLVKIQIYLFWLENKVFLMLIDNQFACNGC